MNYSNDKYDIIIVGGGFAGLTAARELSFLGKKVLLLEARDRLGGRTWTDDRLGSSLEMGGTYVHWYQPHVWTEITRYNQEVVPGNSLKKAYWITEGKLHSGTVEDFNKLAKKGIKSLMKESNYYLPQPYHPLKSTKLAKIDHKSVIDYMDELDLTKEEYDILLGLIATDFSGSTVDGAITQAFRWWAMSNGDWNVHFDVAGGFKLKDGTGTLVNAMASDIKADIQLSNIVTKITHDNKNVTVYTKGGRKFKSDATIVTVPLTTLKNIEFNPPLSQKKQAVIREGQVSKGVKVWARLRGNYEPFMTFAPSDYPLHMVQMEDKVDGDSIIVGFGSDSKLLDPNDRLAVEKALNYWIPDVEVVESTGHNWVEDEFSQETWPMLRPHQLTKYLAELQRPEGALFFAGSTYANGWGSFIDGAIESGLSTSRQVIRYLNN